MCPGPAGPGVHSSESTPMRKSRHSRESELPVEIAMSGSVPSPWISFFGMRKVLSGTLLSMHLTTVGKVYSLRHFPVWTTSGTFEPGGTLLRVKAPVASVTVLAITGGYRVPHVLHEAPEANCGSVADWGT